MNTQQLYIKIIKEKDDLKARLNILDRIMYSTDTIADSDAQEAYDILYLTKEDTYKINQEENEIKQDKIWRKIKNFGLVTGDTTYSSLPLSTAVFLFYKYNLKAKPYTGYNCKVTLERYCWVNEHKSYIPIDDIEGITVAGGTFEEAVFGCLIKAKECGVI